MKGIAGGICPRHLSREADTGSFLRRKRSYFQIQDDFLHKTERHILVEIEPTTACNLSCVICPRRALKREKGSLNKEDFLMTLDHLGPPENGEILLFGGFGEPLLHKELVTFIRLAREKGWFCWVTTNGTLVSIPWLERMLDAGLDVIQVSLHAARPGTYERIAGKPLYRQVVENIHDLVRVASGHILIALNFTITWFNRSEMKRFASYWKGQGISIINFAPCHSRGGVFQDRAIFEYRPPTDPVHTCWLFRYVSYVTFNGRLLACCNDLSGETVLGDLRTQWLSSLNEKKKEIEASGLPYRICRQCDIFFR